VAAPAAAAAETPITVQARAGDGENP